MDDSAYYNKVHGGWLGRVAGSHFGAAIEFRPYWYIQKKYCNSGKEELKSYVKEPNPEAVNDDEIYEIIGLLTLEEKGIDITSSDIAEGWNKYLYGKQFTAERVAIKNIRKGIYPPDSSSKEHGNIWYDAIGGQMKADIWGLIAPGCPNVSADYAKIDGEVAHQGIGIEGEVFIAAIIANAFYESDLKKILLKSLKQLPTESVYSKFVRDTIEIHEKHDAWRTARKEMLRKWHEIRQTLRKSASRLRKHLFLNKWVSAVHVLPNAGIITLSLLYGANDEEDPFGRPICIAGMMGLDTDCNCGNIGTIMGTILGAENIPESWTNPLEDTFNTLVKGHDHWKISQLARRICDAGKTVLKEKCPGELIK
ncbi:MAG: ADP-ribosylglycohydrolase family protein [Candidatus Hodarchaeota archaeon]